MNKNKKNGSSQRPQLTKEQILERKVSMAKERGSRVIKINSPLGSIMFNVLRQFDQAYANLKGKLGEPGGISFEEGAELMERAGKITQDFSDLTKELSSKVNFRYYTPDELKTIQSTNNLNENKTTASLPD